MTANHPTPTGDASRLQEAIDTIAQTFDHPPELSIETTAGNGVRRTTFVISAEGDERTFVLGYDGRSDDSEPRLERPEE